MLYMNISRSIIKHYVISSLIIILLANPILLFSSTLRDNKKPILTRGGFELDSGSGDSVYPQITPGQGDVYNRIQLIVVGISDYSRDDVKDFTGGP
ncbi:MAG: hypothetical protein ACTSXD_12750 [Candidatus Heimdallarchaeaceae archaeon]